jgi:hypothetical protein
MRVNGFAVLAGPTPIEIVIGLASGILWGLTYVLVIRRALRDKIYAMPLAAMCANLVWEFIYTFVFKPSGSGFEYWAAFIVNLVWFLLDVGILWTWLKYWQADYPSTIPGSWHLPMLFAGLLTASAVLVGIQLQFDGNPPGGISSFAQNLMMSILFISMWIRRGDDRGQSVGIAVSKMLGSAFASLYFLMTGFTTFYWVSLFVLIFCYDLFYLWLVLRGAPRPAAAAA